MKQLKYLQADVVVASRTTNLYQQLDVPCHCNSSNPGNGRNGGRPRIAIATLFSGLQAAKASKQELEVVNCTKQTKMEYAARHGYLFLDEGNFSDQETLPLLPHMKVQDKPLKEGRFQKLQFLISMFEKHADKIEWLLWMDADAAITDLDTKLEDRLVHFQQLFLQRQKERRNRREQQKRKRFWVGSFMTRWIRWLTRTTTMTMTTTTTMTMTTTTHQTRNPSCPDKKLDNSIPPMSMVIAHDHKGINNGVFLIRNNEQGRRILITSYMTYVDPNHGYADQMAMTNAVLNRTISNSTLIDNILELTVEDAYLLQNYAIQRISRNHPMWWSSTKKRLEKQQQQRTGLGHYFFFHYYYQQRLPFSIHMPHSPSRYRKKMLGPAGINLCPDLLL